MNKTHPVYFYGCISAVPEDTPSDSCSNASFGYSVASSSGGILTPSPVISLGSFTKNEAYVVNGTLTQKTTKATIKFAMSEACLLAPIPYAMAKPRLSDDRRMPVVYARMSTWTS